MNLETIKSVATHASIGGTAAYFCGISVFGGALFVTTLGLTKEKIKNLTQPLLQNLTQSTQSRNQYYHSAALLTEAALSIVPLAAGAGITTFFGISLSLLQATALVVVSAFLFLGLSNLAAMIPQKG